VQFGKKVATLKLPDGVNLNVTSAPWVLVNSTPVSALQGMVNWPFNSVISFGFPSVVS
jgi:hypothetical protein